MTNPSSDEETVKVKVTLAWSYSIHKHETEVDTGIPLSEWNAMTAVERDRELDQVVDDEISNHSNCGAQVITEGAES